MTAAEKRSESQQNSAEGERRKNAALPATNNAHAHIVVASYAVELLMRLFAQIAIIQAIGGSGNDGSILGHGMRRRSDYAP